MREGHHQFSTLLSYLLPAAIFSHKKATASMHEWSLSCHAYTVVEAGCNFVVCLMFLDTGGYACHVYRIPHMRNRNEAFSGIRNVKKQEIESSFGVNGNKGRHELGCLRTRRWHQQQPQIPITTNSPSQIRNTLFIQNKTLDHRRK